jgi:hypothetical protein
MFKPRKATVLRAAGAGLLGLALAAAGGCSSGKATVSGKVAFANGTAVPAGTITFWADDGRQAQATLKPDGSYSMGDAPVGEVKVTVETPKPREGMGGGMRGMDPTQSPQGKQGMPADMIPQGEKGLPGDIKIIPVPDRYRDKSSTPLTYTVTKGTQQHDFTITP